MTVGAANHPLVLGDTPVEARGQRPGLFPVPFILDPHLGINVRQIPDTALQVFVEDPRSDAVAFEGMHEQLGIGEMSGGIDPFHESSCTLEGNERFISGLE